MGKNDVALSSYFSDPQIFADLFNAWMYGGKQVIDYSAPVRIMQFDSADYQNQVRRTEEENRKRMGLKTGLLPGGQNSAGDHSDSVFWRRRMGQAGAAS